MQGEDFNTNELFNSVGHNSKIWPLNWPIIAHILTEQYDKTNDNEVLLPNEGLIGWKNFK